MSGDGVRASRRAGKPLCLKGPARMTPEVEIFPLRAANQNYTGWIRGTCHCKQKWFIQRAKLSAKRLSREVWRH